MKQKDFVIHGHFTKVPQSILNDNRLSAQAVGIYVMIVHFFMISGFILYKSMLMKRFSNGAASFNRAWNELKKFGYLKIEKKHVNGRYAYEYELFDRPGDQCSDKETENPCDAEVESVADAEQSKNNYPEQPKDSRGEKTGSDRPENRKEEKLQYYAFQPAVSADHSHEEEPSVSRNKEILFHHKRASVSGTIQKINDWFSFKKVGAQIDYETLAAREGQEYAKEIVYLMQDVYNAPDGKCFRIGGALVPAAAVKERFRDLDSEKVQSVVLHFKRNAQPIRNTYAYLLTALYNEPAVYHHGIQNEVNHIDLDLYELDAL